MAEITIQDLLSAGVHFGHQTRRWNPKMKKFIFTERNGIYIIDLQKTLALLNKACNVVREIAAKGDYILFVGTKPQASSIMLEEAERCGQFHVTNRWAGGMLTNYRTIRQSIKRLDHLETMSTDGTFEQLTKKEVLNLEKQRGKLSYVLEGIRKMNKVPGLLIVVDTKKEKIAVNEARRLGIPICAIIDTNCDPDPITLPIPGNDDAIRSIKVLLSTLTDAVIEGMQLYTDKNGIEEKEETVLEAEKQEKELKKRGVRIEHREKTDKAGPAKTDKDSAGAGEKREKAQKPKRKIFGKPPKKAPGKIESETEVKIEVKTEAKAEAKAEIKAEVKVEAKAETEAKEEVKTEKKTDSKAAAKTDKKETAKTDSKKSEKEPVKKAASTKKTAKKTEKNEAAGKETESEKTDK